MEFDVFLSHNSKDKSAVRELKELLVANGLTVWLDEDELQPGMPWQQLLEVGIKTSKSVAVLVGKDGLGPWEDEEMQGALVLAVKDKRSVIPVLLPGASAQPELPMFLSNRTWVDLRAGLADDSLAKLIWGITGIRPMRIAKKSPPASEVIVAPTRLHHGADHLFGREEELADLDEAWDNPAKHIVTIVAFGGVGKTSLIFESMARQAAKNWEGFERVFDWSFYSQGTSDQSSASAESFIAEALKFFGDPGLAQSPASAWDKASRLAGLVSEHRTLLVLDGVEPMQYPPGPLAGQLKDPALATLLKALAQRNPGLCIVTTRETIVDLAAFRETTAPEWKLEFLSEEAGAALLHQSGANRAGAVAIKRDDAELRAASREVRGHGLTLRLLGGYLALAEGGDIRKRALVKFEDADREFKTNPNEADKTYGHAFKMMAAYEEWLKSGGAGGHRQLAVLRLLGLFDRPADGGCLAALRKRPAIGGLTKQLVNLSTADWNITVNRLANCGLVSVTSANPQSAISNPQSIDAHPLLREYFAQRLRTQRPDAWRAGHRRLYEHLCATTKEGDQPTLESLQPLYQAVAHGCQAGMQQQACDDVYSARITRGKEAYVVKKLSAFGSDLGAIACLFDRPWSHVSLALRRSHSVPLHGGVTVHSRSAAAGFRENRAVSA